MSYLHYTWFLKVAKLVSYIDIAEDITEDIAIDVVFKIRDNLFHKMI